MLKLSELRVNPGARKKRTRVGRGEGSGLGKTSGRGGKGQTARAGGKVRAGFEGGQMPLYRRLPKVGFTSRVGVQGKNKYVIVKLDALEALADGTTVDAALLATMGYAERNGRVAGIKLLSGNKPLSKKLQIKVHAVSESAKAAVEKAGGSIEILVHKASGKSVASA